MEMSNFLRTSSSKSLVPNPQPSLLSSSPIPSASPPLVNINCTSTYRQLISSSFIPNYLAKPTTGAFSANKDERIKFTGIPHSFFSTSVKRYHLENTKLLRCSLCQDLLWDLNSKMSVKDGFVYLKCTGKLSFQMIQLQIERIFLRRINSSRSAYFSSRFSCHFQESLVVPNYVRLSWMIKLDLERSLVSREPRYIRTTNTTKSPSIDET